MKGQQIKEERIWGVGEKETEKGKERVNQQNRKRVQPTQLHVMYLT